MKGKQPVSTLGRLEANVATFFAVPDLLPNISVEHAEVGGFVEVVVADFGSGFQVSDGAGEAKDLVVGPGGEAHFVDCRSQDFDAVFIQWTELANLFACLLYTSPSPRDRG